MTSRATGSGRSEKRISSERDIEGVGLRPVRENWNAGFWNYEPFIPIMFMFIILFYIFFIL